MDVVASTLERMHSWVEVDSTPGCRHEYSIADTAALGDRTRDGLSLGRPGIWDADAVRPNRGTVAGRPIRGFSRAVVCRTVSGPAGQCEMTTRHLIVMAQGWQPGESGRRRRVGGSGPAAESERRLGLLVDEIVGPEEVVVRPLPGLAEESTVVLGRHLVGNRRHHAAVRQSATA